MIHTWKGKPIAALSREELIEVVNWFSRELETLREDRNAWMKSGSAVQYMLQKDIKGEIKWIGNVTYWMPLPYTYHLGPGGW